MFPDTNRSSKAWWAIHFPVIRPEGAFQYHLCSHTCNRLPDKTSADQFVRYQYFIVICHIVISNAGSTPYRPRLSFGDGDLETESDDSDFETDASVQDHDMQSLVPILERTIGELHNAAKSQDDEDKLKNLSGEVEAERSRYLFSYSALFNYMWYNW